MNPFNKGEAVGIFLSIAIMALALSFLRFKTDVFVAQVGKTNQNQGAVVVVSQEQNNGTNGNVRQALYDAYSANGKLVNLVIDDVRIGTGAEVKNGDTVVVNYVGTTQSGVKFDSSYDRNQPFEFTVGGGKVIEGWEKGLIGMKVGGERILAIPATMAYGNRQVGPIPANSNLVFSIELLSIK